MGVRESKRMRIEREAAKPHMSHQQRSFAEAAAAHAPGMGPREAAKKQPMPATAMASEYHTSLPNVSRFALITSIRRDI